MLCTTFDHDMLCGFPSCAALCCAVLCCAVLCCAVLPAPDSTPRIQRIEQGLTRCTMGPGSSTIQHWVPTVPVFCTRSLSVLHSGFSRTWFYALMNMTLRVSVQHNTTV